MIKESKFFKIHYTETDSDYIDKLIHDKEFARSEIANIYNDYRRKL